MGTLTLRREDGRIVCERVAVADRAHRRMRGLMGRRQLSSGQGMVLRPAFAIHTHFMRFPIDLVFLDKTNRVTKIREAMPPWRFDFTNAAGVIEINPGAARANDIRPGDRLRFEPVTEGEP
jgi:uncharacterized membrane protein (UPF0127 family)